MNKSNTMKAVVVSPEGPQLASVAVPVVGPQDVLVRVHAAALNRADLHVAAGHRHGASGGAGAVIGIEWAGEVAALGDEVPAASGLAVGDRVMCSGAGGYAEYAVTDWGRVYKLSSASTDFVQAATLPIALQTAHEAITASGGFQRGEVVMVQGASSSVGLMSLQVARLLGASRVIGTSTRPERQDKLKAFGADTVVDTRDDAWPQHVLAATSGQGADLLVDFVAGPMMNRNMQATRICGRIVNVGRMGGFSAEFDFDLHSLRRIRYIGVTFRTRSREEVRDIARHMRHDLWDAVSSGAIRLPVHTTFPLEDALQALACMRTNAHFGKIVLTV
jgi:NADPH:quinone reductase